jgi:hypothetical protein
MDLLSTFSIQQIITFCILGALSFKGIIEFLKWGKGLYDEKFNKDYKKIKQEEDMTSLLGKYDNLEQKIDYLTTQMSIRVDKIENQLNLLTQSDMNDIKGWIVEKHHNLIKQGWVDDFTMDTLERRYSDYKAEEGNSYVKTLMTELRALPKFPPQD